MKSRIQKSKECWVCGAIRELHDHHIIYDKGNRPLSEKYGLKVFLCGYHHNLSDEGVHFNKELDRQLKELAQRTFEEKHGSREDFRRIFGKSYL